MWLPTQTKITDAFNSDSSVTPHARRYKVFALISELKTFVQRAREIRKPISLPVVEPRLILARCLVQWKKDGGVLLLGYEMFRLLAEEKMTKNESIDPEHFKKLSEDVQQAIVSPGPDLVICDEGHRIKNGKASISKVLKRIATKRRVVLTGYPLQNCLMEYWCMIDFVRPDYLGSDKEFANMFEKPIKNGQCRDSTEQDRTLMKMRAHVLYSLVKGFVQR